MDSQKRDEIRDRRGEEALARRVGDALDQLAPRDAGECPDAELIAAYHEKSLQPDEIARWESHIANCGRCRKILAVLAAGVETPLAEKEVAHLGELVAAARAPSAAAARPIRITRPNRLAWRTRWLAPALGVAAVLAVWFAMRPPWRTSHQSPSGTLIAQAPKNEPPQSPVTPAMDQSSKVTPKKIPETAAEALKDRPATSAQSSNPPADALAENPLDSGRAIGGAARRASDAEKTLRDEKKEKAESTSSTGSGAPAGEFGTAASAPRALAPPRAKTALALPREAQVQTAGNGVPVTTPPSATTQSVEVTGVAPLVSTTGNAKGDVTGNAPALDKQAPTATGEAVDKTPPPPPAPPAPAARPSEPLAQAQAKAQIEAGQEAPQVTASPQSTAQSVMVTGAAPVVETENSTLGKIVDNARNVADLPMNGRNFQNLLKLGAIGETAVQVKTPSGTVFWRAGKGGNIQRSTDAGRNWIVQPSPLREEWLAGAAISDTVCWLVGRDGAIARTTDGNHWKKIRPPRVGVDSSGKLPDWIGITAAGAQTATITAGDQRSYVTQDGGKTWKAQ